MVDKKTINLEPEPYYNFIKYLYIEAQDSNPNSQCGIPDVFGFPRGHNVKTKTDPPPMPDETGSSVKLLIETGEMLLGVGGYLAVASELISFSVEPITIPVSAVILAWGWYEHFAKAQYNSTDVVERVEGQRAYIKVPANRTDPYPSYVQDATLNIVLFWLLTDDARDQHHNLTIKATVEYGYASYSWNLTTTVNVKINPDKGADTFENATQIQPGQYYWLYTDRIREQFDFYKVYVPFLKSVTAKIDIYSDTDDDCNLYL